jgi:hypothetical protein
LKRQLPIHPLLFALFPVLCLYSANVAEVSLRQVLWPMLAVLAAAILMVLLAWLVLRDLRRASLLASLALILCFACGYIVRPMNDSSSTVLNNLAKVILAAWAVILAVAAYFIRKTRWDFRKPTVLLNIVGAVMVVVPTIAIAANEMTGSWHPATTPDTSDIQLSMPETPRDIYYIILDRYPSASALEEQHGFDNSEFLNFLSSKGFFVASESHANYAFTAYSLASSLNMIYLDTIGQEVGEDSTDKGPLYGLVQDYEVWRLLKPLGYEYIHFGSWFEPTRRNACADVNVNRGPQLSEFSMTLLRNTVLDPIGTSLGLWGDPRKTQWERVRYEFDKLAEVPERTEPTFVFAHFTVPHPDFVFDSDGSFLTPEVAAQRSTDAQYIDQLVATNKMVETLIDSLLADSETPPIIILQGDEGDVPWGIEWNDMNWDQVTDTELREELGILNAYYFPGIDAGTFCPSATPINSFRQVFNLYFNGDLELLPDRSYISCPGRPYAFYDVTDRVQ